MAAFGNELVICNHEDDFIPGFSILQNITAEKGFKKVGFLFKL
jgi:hypothetical protein